MRKACSRLISMALFLALLFSQIPQVQAANTLLSLSDHIRSREKRQFVEAMLSYHLRENTTVRKTLESGYSAVFFFEGCSDNMDDPDLSDLTYYRVTAVCIVVKLDEKGDPQITYFNENCSTLPDRPLDFGAWNLEDVGDVGPATVCDGTYELYSVYHAGSYEALHMRTSYQNETISAIYLTQEGFVNHPATYINIHTRTGNHALKESMWSAGCLLVGDGQWIDFANLIVETYYSNYREFKVGRKVGCVTINRQFLQDQMYELYEDQDAVDALLVSSRCELPVTYLDRCTEKKDFAPKLVRTNMKTELMTLPCSNSVDARSIPVTSLDKGDRIDICGSMVNTKGQLWYEVSFSGGNCYIPAGNVEEVIPTLIERIRGFFSF